MGIIKIAVLDTSDFEGGLAPTNNFLIHTSKVEIGNLIVNEATLYASYNRHFDLTINFPAAQNSDAFIELYTANNPPLAYLPEATKFIRTVPCTLLNGETGIETVPSKEPFLVGAADQVATMADIVVVNGLEFHLPGKNLEFLDGDFRFQFKQFKSAQDLHNNSKSHPKDNLSTGAICMTKKDGSEFSAEEAILAIKRICLFLSFARGAHSGLGHIVARNADGAASFCYLGFTPTDQFRITSGWCDGQIVNSLPEIFSLYCSACADSITAQQLTRAIEFYRASNVTRESSLEMAIIASHAALETLVPHILETRAGWSVNLLKGDIHFHDKLRAAMHFVGINSDPLEHLSNLVSRSKASDNIDAFALISRFRNKIVHADGRFQYQGIELVEIWSLSQWLCEISIFYLIGYRGQMIDRRDYQGWRGTSVTVPLPSLATAVDN